MPGFVIEGYCFIKPCLAHPFPYINRHFFAEHRFSPFLYRLHIHLDGRKHKFRPGEYASSIEQVFTEIGIINIHSQSTFSDPLQNRSG